jgi:hypothetical protein
LPPLPRAPSTTSLPVQSSTRQMVKHVTETHFYIKLKRKPIL